MKIEAENLNEPQKPQLNIGAVSCSVVHCKKAPYDVYIGSDRNNQILISILSFRSGEVRSLVHHEIENPLDEDMIELLTLAIAEKIIENE